MRPRQAAIAKQLDLSLVAYSATERLLPGIKSPSARNAFVEQLLESTRRVDYIRTISGRSICKDRMNPASDLFDPIRAAISHRALGNIDEAFWLVFLFVYFGKHGKTGWALVRNVYGSLGSVPWWDWHRISIDSDAFRQWLVVNHESLRSLGRFGNHRKYESMDPEKSRNTADVVKSYVKWVGGNHLNRIGRTAKQCGNDPRKTFDALYKSMDDVLSFGRTAKFDYLTMVAKIGLAQIEAPSAYLQGATGPLSGARLLFGDELNASDLNPMVSRLGQRLGLGMQVMEDALCNWQKSPNQFKPFRG